MVFDTIKMTKLKIIIIICGYHSNKTKVHNSVITVC